MTIKINNTGNNNKIIKIIIIQHFTGQSRWIVKYLILNNVVALYMNITEKANQKLDTFQFSFQGIILRFQKRIIYKQQRYDRIFVAVNEIKVIAKRKPEKLTFPQQMWLYNSVGRALHRYHRGHRLESRWSLNFFCNNFNCFYNHEVRTTVVSGYLELPSGTRKSSW